MNSIAIDFEYKDTAEVIFNLVSCTIAHQGEIKSWWLYNDPKAKAELKDWLLVRKDQYMVCFNGTAEGRSFLSLGLNPLDFKWIDLQIEYKMLTNHWDTYRYGKHLKGSKIIHTKRPRPKWEQTSEGEVEDANNSKPETNLASTTFKLLGVKRDSEHKDQMRQLIIHSKEFTDDQKSQIMNYCEQDVVDLIPMLKKLYELQYKVHPHVSTEERVWRGRCSIATACISAIGYPVNGAKVMAFQKALPKIVKDLCEDINSQLSEPIFEWNNKRQCYSEKQKRIKELIHELYPQILKRWPTTDKGHLSLRAEYLKDLFNIRHTYQRGELIHQYVRYKDFQKSSKSLSASADPDKNFLSRIGSDERVRCWLNPYGAQTSRFQPKSSHFLFLKSAWMRALCEPAEDKIIIGCDFKSQEFLLQACLSKDKAMYEAYKSGDVYVAFGKEARVVKVEKGHPDFKVQRSIAKTAVLGIGYGMGANKLAVSISKASGKDFEESQAQALIDNFYEIYSDYNAFRKNTWDEYLTNGYLRALDGWIMYGDNDNRNSVLNFPSQSAGGCILRRAIDICFKNRLDPIIPLHDALYVEVPTEDLEIGARRLQAVMKKASGFYFEGEQKEWAESVGLDFEAWGPQLTKGTTFVRGIKIATEQLHIDDRGVEEYERFSKYWS